MNAVVKFPMPATSIKKTRTQSSALVSVKTNHQALVQRDAWLNASDAQRATAAHRHALVNELLSLTQSGRPLAKAISKLENRYQLNRLPPPVQHAIRALGKNDQLPNRATLYRWIERFQAKGMSGLLSSHKGRQRVSADWQSIAIYEYAQPSKPSMAYVQRKLTEEYDMNVSIGTVRSFINALPAHLGKLCPKRLGANERRKTQMNYIRRTSENLDVGMLYQGDGHTIDVYVQHPSTGNICRPELTVWIDIKSRYVVGWYLSEAESSISTICALSHALIDHNHVPDCLYIDNGSGYKSKMMNAESYGFYSRFGIDTIFAQPGNPGAKGQVERFFNTMEQDFGKSFGAAYCGKDAAQHPLQKFVRDSKKDKSIVPTIQQWMDRFADWLDRYHNRPHPEFKHTTPAKLWATLNNNPVYMEAAAIFRPRTLRTVRRTAIRLHNREYQNNDLIHYNTKTVQVEYDLHDDRQISVLSEQGHFICCADLIYKKGHIPSDRIEEYRQKRLEGQLKRKQRHIDEDRARARARAPITADNTVRELENLGVDLFAIDITPEQIAEDAIEIDLTDY